MPTTYVAVVLGGFGYLGYTAYLTDKHDLFLRLHHGLQDILPGSFWGVFSHLGDGLFLGGLLGLLLANRNTTLALVGASVLVVGGMSVQAVKQLGYPEEKRPAAELPAEVFHPVPPHAHTRHSFPSGHSFAAACALAVLAAGLRRTKSDEAFTGLARRRLFVELEQSGLGALAVLLGLSRIAVGAHWPQDVAVGGLAGLAMGWLAIFLARKPLQLPGWVPRMVFWIGLASVLLAIGIRSLEYVG